MEGPVIDQFGHVFAILPVGWACDQPPSNAAWIIHALMFGVNLVWPLVSTSPRGRFLISGKNSSPSSVERKSS